MLDILHIGIISCLIAARMHSMIIVNDRVSLSVSTSRDISFITLAFIAVFVFLSINVPCFMRILWATDIFLFFEAITYKLYVPVGFWQKSGSCRICHSLNQIMWRILTDYWLNSSARQIIEKYNKWIAEYFFFLDRRVAFLLRSDKWLHFWARVGLTFLSIPSSDFYASWNFYVLYT